MSLGFQDSIFLDEKGRIWHIMRACHIAFNALGLRQEYSERILHDPLAYIYNEITKFSS
jgi:hypothetical protein